MKSEKVMNNFTSEQFDITFFVLYLYKSEGNVSAWFDCQTLSA